SQRIGLPIALPISGYLHSQRDARGANGLESYIRVLANGSATAQRYATSRDRRGVCTHVSLQALSFCRRQQHIVLIKIHNQGRTHIDPPVGKMVTSGGGLT